MTLEDARNIAVIVAAVVGVATLVKGVMEYKLQNAQKRAELYIDLGKQFTENERFMNLFALLENDSEALQQLSYADKLEFLGFFEDIAILMNSGLIRPHVVHYMFAYYAIRCWQSENFWNNMNRDSHYWALFKNLAEEMELLENNFVFDKANYRV